MLSGKWHVGEAEGMRPHDVGFDEFYGYYPAQKELSQAFDKRRYPDLVLNPERLENAARRPGASEALIHGFKGGETTEVQKIDSIEEVAEARPHRSRNSASPRSGSWPKATSRSSSSTPS